ncbi:MAG: hypothetical protein P8M04_09385 [Akkermansiaceae bacterium]|nr:hypothetical protein [Akkermansiaceae bacterium]
MKLLAGLGGIFYACGSMVFAEIDTEIPLGIEAVTGLRTDYVHRGFQLAESALDFQLETKITLSNDNSLSLGFSHLSESDGDFNETSSYLELGHSFTQNLTGGASFTYRDRGESILQGGFDLGLFTSYSINEIWRWRNELNFDLGIDGIYLNSELEWSKAISDKSFVTIKGGLSWVSDYLERDGLNDFHTRVTYTYALSDQISFTPFIGSSIQIDDQDADDILYGGLWFEVIF